MKRLRVLFAVRGLAPLLGFAAPHPAAWGSEGDMIVTPVADRLLQPGRHANRCKA